MKNKYVRILVTFFGGWLGIHKFLDHKIGLGILYLFTGGLLGIGWIIDTINAFRQPSFDSLNKNPVIEFSNPTRIGENLYESIFQVAGTAYYENNIKSLLTPNKDFLLSGSAIAKKYHGERKIYEYNYLNKEAVLVPEPNNPHDPNAIMVLVDGFLVGYVPHEYTAFLHNFIKKNFVLYTSAFITGGNYKIVSADGSSVFLERTCSVRIKIGYKKN